MKEMAVLQYIQTYSTFCAPPSLKIMASAMQTSERTLRRTINLLVSKGMLIKRYRCFKRLHLEIVSLAVQKTLHGAGMVKKALCKSWKRFKKRSHRPNGTDLIRPPVTEPIQNKDLKNKTSSEGLNFGLKTLGSEQTASVNEQLAAFYRKYGMLKTV